MSNINTPEQRLAAYHEADAASAAALDRSLEVQFGAKRELDAAVAAEIASIKAANDAHDAAQTAAEAAHVDAMARAQQAAINAQHVSHSRVQGLQAEYAKLKSDAEAACVNTTAALKAALKVLRDHGESEAVDREIARKIAVLEGKV